MTPGQSAPRIEAPSPGRHALGWASGAVALGEASPARWRHERGQADCLETWRTHIHEMLFNLKEMP
ncbi:MAG: hypothetical protein LBF91_01990 [Azoarcus sp.]|nr:hypothetical protein [Azoarcus sp.]